VALLAAFAAALALAPAFAQRGGGGHGGGGHAGGFGGGGHLGGGSSFGSHSLGGVHSSSSIHAPSFSSRGFSGAGVRGPGVRAGMAGRAIRPSPYLHDGNRQPLTASRFGVNRFGVDRSRNGRFRTGFNFSLRNCWGFNCGWGWGWPWYAGYYDPWWWWDSDSSYDQDQANDLATAEEMNQENLYEQQMRHQEDQDPPYAAAPPVAPRNQSISAESPAAATVLVFRDQHKQEVQNYAIVGQTLFSFAPQRTQKIALGDLDIPATVKANEDRGVEFRVPTGGEGQ